MKKLEEIYSKYQTKKLTTEEIAFILEIEDSIYSFDYTRDPRIDEVKNSLSIEDLNRLFQDEKVYNNSNVHINLYGIKDPSKLVFPEKFLGSLSFPGLKSANGLKLPKYLGGVSLDALENANGITFPEQTNYLSLSKLKIAEGLVLPKNIGTLNLSSLKDPSGLKLSQNIDNLFLYSLERAEDLVFPTVMKELHLSGLVDAKGLKLPIVIETLKLKSLKSAKNLVLPEIMRGELDLSGIEDGTGLICPKKWEVYI